MTTVYIVQKLDACDACRAPQVVSVDASKGGSSVDTQHIPHSFLCPKLRCEHGKIAWGPIRWQEDCGLCDVAAQKLAEEEEAEDERIIAEDEAAEAAAEEAAHRAPVLALVPLTDHGAGR
jgi:hypothetical protein